MLKAFPSGLILARELWGCIDYLGSRFFGFLFENNNIFLILSSRILIIWHKKRSLAQIFDKTPSDWAPRIRLSFCTLWELGSIQFTILTIEARNSVGEGKFNISGWKSEARQHKNSVNVLANKEEHFPAQSLFILTFSDYKGLSMRMEIHI